MTYRSSHLACRAKGTKSIAQYLNKIRVITDELVLADALISDSSLVIKILVCLGPEYNNDISTAIRSRDIPVSLEELLDRLNGHEVFFVIDKKLPLSLLNKTSGPIVIITTNKNLMATIITTAKISPLSIEIATSHSLHRKETPT